VRNIFAGSHTEHHWRCSDDIVFHHIGSLLPSGKTPLSGHCTPYLNQTTPQIDMDFPD